MSDPTISAAILERARKISAAGGMPLAVYDLDGTLYNNSVRTLRILREFAHAHAATHPELVPVVDGMPSDGLPYMVSDILKGVGVTEPTLVKTIEGFWAERFFTDEYLGFDIPMPGALEAVRHLHGAGIISIYLTGRDAPNMLLGTVAALQRDGFPVGTVDTRLILKPEFHTPDTEYKASVVTHLRAQGEVVAVFDNEPGICNLLCEAFPEAVGVWLDTHQAPGAPPLADGIATIRDFCALV